jgi:hypothetical protein
LCAGLASTAAGFIPAHPFSTQVCELNPSTEQIQSIIGALNPDLYGAGAQRVASPSLAAAVDSCVFADCYNFSRPNALCSRFSFGDEPLAAIEDKARHFQEKTFHI